MKNKRYEIGREVQFGVMKSIVGHKSFISCQ